MKETSLLIWTCCQGMFSANQNQVFFKLQYLQIDNYEFSKQSLLISNRPGQIYLGRCDNYFINHPKMDVYFLLTEMIEPAFWEKSKLCLKMQKKLKIPSQRGLETFFGRFISFGWKQSKIKETACLTSCGKILVVQLWPRNHLGESDASLLRILVSLEGTILHLLPETIIIAICNTCRNL